VSPEADGDVIPAGLQFRLVFDQLSIRRTQAAHTFTHTETGKFTSIVGTSVPTDTHENSQETHVHIDIILSELHKTEKNGSTPNKTCEW